MNILLVEDEEVLRETIQYGLEREGFEVATARDGRAALERFRAGGIGLVLLDLMLPEVPGLDVCRVIRSQSTVPIIIITAKDSEADKVTGLEIGADDYVTKPFSMRELVARIRAVARRGAAAPERSRLSVGPIEIDADAHEIRLRGVLIDLTPKEFELMALLAARAGKLVTRETLIREVWGADYVGDTRTLDVHVKRLRAKLEDDPATPAYIKTVRGLGYKIEG